MRTFQSQYFVGPPLAVITSTCNYFNKTLSIAINQSLALILRNFLHSSSQKSPNSITFEGILAWTNAFKSSHNNSIRFSMDFGYAISGSATSSLS